MLGINDLQLSFCISRLSGHFRHASPSLSVGFSRVLSPASVSLRERVVVFYYNSFCER